MLTEKDIDDISDVKKIIERTEKALVSYSEKNTIMPARYVMEIPGSAGTVRLMPASVPAFGTSGLKILTGTAGKRRAEGSYFVTVLFGSDGSIICIMGSNRLTQLRTGAASAVATKYLARKDSKSIGIVGAGVQGQGQLEAISQVFDFKNGFVFDVFEGQAQKLISFSKDKLGFEMESCSNVKEISLKSDVLVTTTTSKEPFLHFEMINAGTHINAVGSNLPTRREIDSSILNNSRVFVDSIEQVLKESGDLIIPVSSGDYDPSKVQAEIGEVVSGRKKGRSSDEDVTVFKSVGIAVVDVAVAQLVYEEALKNNIGTEIRM